MAKKKKKKKKKSLKEVEEFCLNIVNLLNLEKEVAQHPRMVFKYARMLNICVTKIAEKKSELALCDAEIEADIRARPDEFDLPEKPTVGAISSTILRQKEHQQIDTELKNLIR